MTNKQPETLRLAAMLETGHGWNPQLAAALLRTQHALLERAREALENLQGLCTDADDGWYEAVTIWTPEIIADLTTHLEPKP